MMKITLTTIFLLFLIMAQAQEADTTKHWKAGTDGSVTFSQVSLTNWAAGGEDSYSANGLFNFFANYKKDKSSWENGLTIGYGFIKVIDDNLKKSTDQIDFQSKYGKNISKYWSYSALINFKTQFTEGYHYPDEGPRTVISDFMSPAYIIASIGMDHKPVENFSFFISPATGKTTVVIDEDLSDAGAFGVEPGDNILSEYGGFVKVEYSEEVLKNINLKTKLDLFSAYNNNPENIDVDWEMVLNMEINKYISANLQTRLLYDHDTKIEQNDGTMAPMVQFKEVFGAGISYRFPE